MGGLSGRSRMLSSVDGLTGASDTTEAILIQKRPPWILVALIASVVVGEVIGNVVGIGDSLMAVLRIACAPVAYIGLTSYWILAHRPGEVILARSSKLTARAIEVAERWPAPLNASLNSAILSKKVELGNNQYYVARGFVGRFGKIVNGG